MSGIVVEVTPKRSFNFDDLDQNTTQTLTIAERIDVSQWPIGYLMVNVFSAAISSTSTITVSVQPDGFTTEDPSVSFIDPTVANAEIDLGSATVTGDFETEDFSGTWGSVIAVTITATRASGDTNPLNADIQVRLSMKGFHRN